MSGCTKTGDMPLISILMAVYEPRMDWLREQLLSLEAQTYPNLRLYICDDCSPAVPLADIEALVRECIRSFPWELKRNGENLGSNATFQRLTAEAEGDCFAYCDQDDIWLPEKLALLREAMVREQADLICSDVLVIDSEGRLIANSMTEIRKKHAFQTGKGLAPKLLVSNFVTGCTMLIRADTARAAIPFCPYMVHDHYLAFRCAVSGSIGVVFSPLIRYRIHSGNQTKPMAGVKNKERYIALRITDMEKRLLWLADTFSGETALCEEIGAMLQWVRARADNFNGYFPAKRSIWALRRFGPLTSLYEILFAGMPDPLFMLGVRFRQRGL